MIESSSDQTQLADLTWSTALRLAGSPWDDLLELKDEALLRDVEQHWTLGKQQQLEARKVAEQLGTLLPLIGTGDEATDVAAVSLRRALLSLKRDLFNGRPRAALQAGSVLQADPVLRACGPHTALLEAAFGCARQLASHSEQLKLLEQRYTESRLQAQQRLQQRTGNAPWLPAVALRSESAYRRLRQWCSGNLTPGSKPYRQAVLAALGYCSRTVAKTSPRSRFTVVALPETMRQGNELRLSVAYFRAFVELLLSENDTLPAVRSNPTLHEHEGRLRWLCWERGKELSRSIVPGDSPAALLDAALQPSSVDELALVLHANSPQERQLLKAALQKLLKIGALIPVLATSPEDPDFFSMLEKKAQDPEQRATDRQTLLRQVSSELETLRASTVEFGSLRRLTASLDATQSGRTEDVVFENTFETPRTNGHQSYSVVQEFLNSLGHLPPLAHARWRVGQTLRRRFEAQGRLPLLPCVSQVSAAVQQQTGEWENYPLGVSYPGPISHQEVELSPEMLRACRAESDVEAHPLPTLAVWAAYVQLNDGLSPCLNRMTPGFGARMARFLRETDPETARLRRRAHRLSERAMNNEIRLAEVRSAFWNSANQAPPIFESFIDLPFVRPADWQKPVVLRELEIQFGAERPFPRLVDRRTDQEIVPIWLGLERWSRSPLLSALQAFSPTSWEHPWYALLRDINRRCCPVPLHDQRQVTSFPRIHFDGRLTLQRRSFWIPGSELEFLDRGSEFTTWLELRSLRRALDLPEAVFVQSYDPKRAPREGKPQLVLLDSPLFMDVVKRVRRTSPGGIMVSECEPEPCAGRSACELLVEMEVGSP